MPEDTIRTGAPPTKLNLMVSSPVYGLEGLLDQIFAMLEGYGYEVWMSCKGTIPTDPRRTAFSNCLAAVDNCDAFLGIITGHYGSGVGTNRRGITHREIVRAVNRKKLRWFLVHHDVTIARQLLKQFRFDEQGNKKPYGFFRKTAILDDIRVLDMYESAIRHGRPLSRRAGNWVQEFITHTDALRYIDAQFRDSRRLNDFLTNLRTQ
jgi:Domain of unknown function (DUF4062)